MAIDWNKPVTAVDPEIAAKYEFEVLATDMGGNWPVLVRYRKHGARVWANPIHYATTGERISNPAYSLRNVPERGYTSGRFPSPCAAQETRRKYTNVIGILRISWDPDGSNPTIEKVE